MKEIVTSPATEDEHAIPGVADVSRKENPMARRKEAENAYLQAMREEVRLQMKSVQVDIDLTQAKKENRDYAQGSRRAVSDSVLARRDGLLDDADGCRNEANHFRELAIESGAGDPLLGLMS